MSQTAQLALRLEGRMNTEIKRP